MPQRPATDDEMLEEFPRRARAEGWFLRVEEFAPGGYHVTARDRWGRQVTHTCADQDLERTIEECERYAESVGPPGRGIEGDPWDIQIRQQGRSGSIDYSEGANRATVDWEFGGDDVVVIVMSPSASEWDRLYPWAAGRQREILERIGATIVERKARSCWVDFDPRSPETLLIREPKR